MLVNASGTDLSETPVEEMSDDQFLAEVGKIRSGEASHERAIQNTVRRQSEELEWWLQEHRAGNVLPRNVEEHLQELGLLA